ncbi:MAG: phytoene/squalene synthase family protein [Pseudomonadota bacterium]
MNLVHPRFTEPSQGDTSDRQRADLQACVTLMRGGSKTFFAASRLLPLRIRAASIALYAFCRVADDVVDEGDSPQAGLARLKDRLDAIYSGAPQAFVEDRALCAVVQQHHLPRLLLDALLEGFSWDSSARRYETLADVHDYAARVAGSVGAMMCWLMGVREPQALARACELGLAMQLTNIARDVGTDARNGRLYLPRQWLRESGIDPDAWLMAPTASPEILELIERLLQEADRLYGKASQGIAALPKECRAAILAARLIYAEIGQQLRRDGLDSVARRAVVPLTRKLGLLATAWWTASDAGIPGAAHVSAAETAIVYLVAHCTQAAESLALARRDDFKDRPTAPGSRPLGERAAWMIELFERQEAQRRAGRSPSTAPARGGLSLG